MATKSKLTEEDRLVYIINYLFLLLSGVVVFLVAAHDNKRLKKHAVQAIALGVVTLVLGFVPFVGGLLGFLIWIYGMYVGIEAYNGKDVVIPVLSDYIK